jgi:hypothetical protein
VEQTSYCCENRWIVRSLRLIAVRPPPPSSAPRRRCAEGSALSATFPAPLVASKGCFMKAQLTYSTYFTQLPIRVRLSTLMSYSICDHQCILTLPAWVGSRSPMGWWFGLSTAWSSHPGDLRSIAKREEPGKTGAPCVTVPGSFTDPRLLTPPMHLDKKRREPQPPPSFGWPAGAQRPNGRTYTESNPGGAPAPTRPWLQGIDPKTKGETCLRVLHLCQGRPALRNRMLVSYAASPQILIASR